MKSAFKLIAVFSLILIVSCNMEAKGPRKRMKSLEEKIESQEERIKELENMKQGLGQTMTQIQVQHAKLAQAVNHNNGELISYILHEMEENFEYIVENHAEHDGINIGQLTENLINPSIEEFESAIKSGQDSAFTQYYENLTVSCNKCHTASGHPYLKIVAPTDNTFLNQDFKPQ